MAALFLFSEDLRDWDQGNDFQTIIWAIKSKQLTKVEVGINEMANT